MSAKAQKVAAKPVRRGRPPILREGNTIPKLREMKKATASQLGVSGAHMATLVEGGYARVLTTVKLGGVGRPANLYGLTRKGSGLATAITNRQKLAVA
jgi:hypothetical protein